MGGNPIKRIKEGVTIFITFLILFSFTNQVISIKVLAQDESTPNTLIGKIAKALGHFFGKNVIMPMQFFLVAAKATPSALQIGYGESVSFEIGMLDLTTGDYLYFNRTSQLFNARYLNFEIIEYPGGNDGNTWTVKFNPYTVDVKFGTTVKTNATLSLRAPPVLSNAIQSGILKVRIWDTWANGNLWFNPGGKNAPLLGRIVWFTNAFTMGYGRASGTVDVTPIDVEILVKIKPYHAVNFESIPYIEFKPDTITSLPITLENIGNYNDTYTFNITSENKDLELSDPVSITLAPGEKKDTYLGISIPPNFFDFGTIHQVKIEAFSIDQPNISIGERTILFETKGIHVTEMGAIGVIFLIFIIFLIAGLFFYKRKSLYEQICPRPNKPWEIPDEKRYLDSLKDKDSDKYKEIMNMMEDEYTSSLLWHKFYCESEIRKDLKEKEKVREEKIKKVKAKKEKARKEKLKLIKEKQKEIKIEKEEVKKKEKKEIETKIPKQEKEPIQVEKEEVVIDKKVEEEKLRKERALLRIKLEQERQRKKFNKLGIKKRED